MIHMKKITAIIAAFLCFISTTVSAYDVSTDNSLFFCGISNIATNGEIFTGVSNGYLVTSDDFSDWQSHFDVHGIENTQYINGQFFAISSGCTWVSADTVSWQQQTNNLPAGTSLDKVFRNGDSVVVFVNDYNGTAGTYQSFDCINWKRVENIPDGCDMEIINDKFVFFSGQYMKGLYFSDTGEEFTFVDVPGLEITTGGCCVSYYDGLYHIYDYRESGSVHYFSTDLINWQTEPMSSDILDAAHSSFAEIGGEVHRLTQNGYDYVYRDGSWHEGIYDMSNMANSTSDFPPFIDYAFPNEGILAWDHNLGNCYYISPDGQMLTYDGDSREGLILKAQDGLFYMYSYQYETDDSATNYVSEDGLNWSVCDREDMPSGMFALTAEEEAQLSASNGSAVLTSEFIERGSQAGRDINDEITAVLTEADGSQKKIAYEDGRNDFVAVYGGDGYFILGNFSSSWYTYYYSADGITRSEPLIFDRITSRLRDNGRYILYFDQGMMLHRADKSQFENLSIPASPLVKLNDEYLSFMTPPIMENDRILIPVRFLFERLGAEVGWNQETYTASFSYGGNTVEITIDSPTALVNGAEIPLEVPARLVNDKTLVPLRFVSENLGLSVSWDQEGYTAVIQS